MLSRWMLALATATALLGCGRPPADSPSLAPARVTRVEPGGVFEPQRGRTEIPPAERRGSTSVSNAGENVFVWFSEVWQTPALNKSNPANIADACCKVIDSARRTLDVCVFEIDNERIVQAILAAHRRGVRVRVVTESDYMHELGPQQFQRAGIPVVPDNRTDLMHNKFMVVDGRMVWTGSFNFTENCAYKNNNNAVLLIDESAASNYSEKFRWMFDLKKFGGKPERNAQIPYPVVLMSDGTTVECLFSTHDKADRRIIELLGKATRSIYFMAFSFTHTGISAAMSDAARRGVRVVGVVETRQNSVHSEVAKLQQVPGIDVLLDGNSYNMHHKVIVLDEQVTITGSFNFSASAANNNDENVVILYNSGVASRFLDEFRRVYGQAANNVSSAATSNRSR